MKVKITLGGFNDILEIECDSLEEVAEDLKKIVKVLENREGSNTQPFHVPSVWPDWSQPITTSPPTITFEPSSPGWFTSGSVKCTLGGTETV